MSLTRQWTRRFRWIIGDSSHDPARVLARAPESQSCVIANSAFCAATRAVCSGSPRPSAVLVIQWACKSTAPSTSPNPSRSSVAGIEALIRSAVRSGP